MDIIEIIVTDLMAQRALLFEQFLTTHRECWPEPIVQQAAMSLTKLAKCSCGAELEVTLLTKLVIAGHK